MKTLYIDLETYYDNLYSLRKISTVEYVFSEAFECYMASWAIDDGPVHVTHGQELPELMRLLPWAELRVVCHNVHFDAAVLAWHYRIPSPGAWGCSLASARMAHPEWPRHSLDACSQQLGLQVKRTDVLHRMCGLRWRDAPEALRRDVIAYAKADTENHREVWKQTSHKLIGTFEGRRLDYAVRLWTEPTLMVDPTILLGHKVKLVQDLSDSIAWLESKFGIDAAMLRSDDKLFAKCVELELDPPTKLNSKGVQRPAFAKSDTDFIDWQADPDPVKCAIVDARLGVKSSLELHRVERLIKIAHTTGGVLPVPLVYGNTNTLRLAGGEKINLQNLPRFNKDGSPPTLKRSIHAPLDHKVVAVDASQIECRLNAWWAGEDLLLDCFREGRDAYCEFGTTMFQRSITKGMPERHPSKVAVLSCGYGAWVAAFERMLFANKVVPPRGMTLYELAYLAVTTYRRTYSKITVLWKLCEQMLPVLLDGDGGRKRFIGPVRFEKGRITLPSGHEILYPGMGYEQDEMTGKWGYYWTRRGRKKKIYGSLIDENVVQSMAGDAVAEAWDRVVLTYGRRIALQVHDELISVAHNDRADEAVRIMKLEMSCTPSWAPGLPLSAEGGHAVRYGDIKKS